MRSRNILLVLMPLFLTSSACQREMTFNRGAEEATIKALDAEWSKAAGSKNVDKTVLYYADDAIVMPSNSPALTGEQAIRAMWQGMLGAPNFSGGWTATKVEVAGSGDMAYVTGTYEMSETGADGKPMTDKGKYLEVWRKQPDGSWKCVADMFNTNLPAR